MGFMDFLKNAAESKGYIHKDRSDELGRIDVPGEATFSLYPVSLCLTFKVSRHEPDPADGGSTAIRAPDDFVCTVTPAAGGEPLQIETKYRGWRATFGQENGVDVTKTGYGVVRIPAAGDYVISASGAGDEPGAQLLLGPHLGLMGDVL